MIRSNANDPVEVYAGSAWEAEIVKTLLKDAEIEVFVKDEIMGTLLPWYTAPGGAGSVSVFVSYLDHNKARLIVEDFQKNMKGNY